MLDAKRLPDQFLGSQIQGQPDQGQFGQGRQDQFGDPAIGGQASPQGQSQFGDIARQIATALSVQTAG